MKNISPQLRDHLNGSVITVATLWRIQRLDGRIFTFTDHDQPITYIGEEYEAATGYSPSAIRSSAALDVDNMEVDGVITSATITDEDLLAGLWDFAAFKISRVNYRDLSMGEEVLRVGTIGNVKTGKSSFNAELRGITQPLQQATGRIYQVPCDADLGDNRCKVNLADFTVTGTVTSVTNQSIFEDSGRGEANGYFAFGLLTFTSGDNEHFQMEVKEFQGGQIKLQQAMPQPIQVGDTYSVYAGCDKSLGTCINKFTNVINHRGFPHVPGMDRMASGT